jgi:hypothetical protein
MFAAISAQDFFAAHTSFCCMKRCRNSATPEDVAKVLRGVLPKGPDMKKVCDPDIDSIIDSFAEILCDTLRITPRPTQKVFKDAAVRAWDFDIGEADMFGNRMAHAVIHCRIKKNQSTTGKKLPPGVFKVVEILRQQDRAENANPKQVQKPSMGQKFLKEARRLQKRNSDEKKTEAALQPEASSSGGLSSSSSRTSELVQLSQLYGMKDLCKPHVSENVVDLMSSQECETPAPKCVEFFDSSICKLVREYADGTKQVARMMPGQNGLATATFEGEQPKPTECPNLLLQGTVYKKPAAARVSKRPAAAPMSSDSSDDVDVVEDNEQAGSEEVPKIKKTLLYSKIYHRAKTASLKSGKTPDEAKVAGRDAGKAALAAARAAGTLED